LADLQLESWTNIDLATTAWKATQAGAEGVADVAVDLRATGDAFGLRNEQDEVQNKCQALLRDVHSASRRLAHCL